MPETLRDRISVMVRALRPERTTGAYGDEGALLCLLDEVARGAAVCERVAPPPLSFRDAWRNGAPVEAIPESVLMDCIAYARAVAYEVQPIRFRMETRETRRMRSEIAMRCRAHASEVGPLVAAHIEGGLLEAILDRRVFRVERGGPTWQAMLRMDLLHLAAPFVVEVEGSQNPEAVPSSEG